MPIIVGVRFKPVGKIYYFSPLGIDFKAGDGVIVETARGVEYGKIAIPPTDIEEKSNMPPLKPILRKATEYDEKQVVNNMQKRLETLKVAAEKIKRHKLKMKLIDAEYTFDGNKVIFYFTAEGRVDFRELVRDLASVFKIRIELRQIGVRDQSKMLGGIAPCGKACCCSEHLPEFKHVSIKMAKTQMLSLNPVKISGLCGRLMCCLEYENDYYSAAFKKMPRLGSDVDTDEGRGMVVSNNLLKMESTVKVEKRDGAYEYKSFSLDQLKAFETMTDDVDDSVNDEEIKQLLD